MGNSPLKQFINCCWLCERESDRRVKFNVQDSSLFLLSPPGYHWADCFPPLGGRAPIGPPEGGGDPPFGGGGGGASSPLGGGGGGPSAPGPPAPDVGVGASRLTTLSVGVVELDGGWLVTPAPLVSAASARTTHTRAATFTVPLIVDGGGGLCSVLTVVLGP